MNDDTTGTTAFPTPDGEPTLVLPGADGTPTTSLPARGWHGTPAGSPATHAEAGAATAVLPDPRIAPYLEAASIHLADLPPGERAELLEDLSAHLAEIAADEGPAFAARLGSPDQYAAEFRASAGYPPAGAGSAGQHSPGRVRALGRNAATATRDLGRRISDGVRGFPGGTALMSLLPRLRPAWWVFRAWLAALVIGVDWPTGAYNGMGHWGAFVWQLLFVVLSVAWGLRTERRGAGAPTAERVVLFLLNAIAVWICLLGVFGSGPLTDINSRVNETYSEPQPYSPDGRAGGLNADGNPITNLTAFDLEGNPIPGFQLFDQDGRPVSFTQGGEEMFGPNGETLYLLPATDGNGNPVNGVFPATYVRVSYVTDELTGGDSLKVEQVLSPPRVAPLTGITAPVAPPIGSIVTFGEDGEPDWAGAQAPGAPQGAGISPSPVPTDATAVADEPSASPAATAEASDAASPSATAKAKVKKPTEPAADN